MHKFVKLSQYYCFQLFHSYAYIFINAFIWLISILVVLLVYFLRNKDLDKSSFIISISSQILLIIQMLFIIIKLFNENRYNLSDIKLLGKNFLRNEIFWSKYFIVFINALALVLLITVTNSFLMLGLSTKGTIIGGLFVSNLIGLLINILFFSSILIICAIFFNRIWSPIICLIVVIISPLTSFINHFILVNKQQCNNIDSNINDDNAFVQYNKIYKFDQNNKLIETKYAYRYNYTNNLLTNLNTNIPNSINYTNQLDYLIPGNINISLQSSLYTAINQEVNLNDYLMYDGSLSKIQPSNFSNLSNFIQNGYSYVLVNMNDQNYFNLDSLNLSKLIIDDLKKVINNYSSIINNKQELNAILSKLKKSPIWNINSFNNRQFQFLTDLLGKQYSSLFYSWYYKQYLNANIGDIIGQIANSFNNLELADLLNYLWFSDSSYFNLVLVNSSSKLMNDFKTLMLKKYPINFVYDNEIIVSSNDLNFLNNYLVKIQNNNVYVLNNNGIYDLVDKQQFLKLFNLASINNQNDWINYLNIQNIPTVSFIRQVYQKISSIKNDIVNLNIENNNFNLNTFDQVFDLVKIPFANGYVTTIIMQICLCSLFISLAYLSYLKTRLD